MAVAVAEVEVESSPLSLACLPVVWSHQQPACQPASSRAIYPQQQQLLFPVLRLLYLDVLHVITFIRLLYAQRKLIWNDEGFRRAAAG